MSSVISEVSAVASGIVSGIGGITDGGGLFPTFVPSSIADQTVLGCPISSFMSLDSRCPLTGTGLPACATQTAELDEPCCGSLSAFASSVGDCYSSNAPSCLNLEELSSSLNAFSATATDAQVTNPCERFAPASASASGSDIPAETGGQPVETGSSRSSGESGGSGGSGNSDNSGNSGGSTSTKESSTTSAGGASATSSSGGVKERGNMGLRTIASLVLVGSLGVLWL